MINFISLYETLFMWWYFYARETTFHFWKIEKIKSYIWYHCKKVKLAHYKSRTDFLKVLFTCQSFIKSVAWWLPIGIKLELKVSKSQKHFFLKLHCPKNEPNIWQNSALASWEFQEKMYCLFVCLLVCLFYLPRPKALSIRLCQGLI